MIDLQLDPLIEPVPPDDPDAPDFPIWFDIWREDHKAWLHRVEGHRKVMEQIFPTVLGQCDPASGQGQNWGGRDLGQHQHYLWCDWYAPSH
jgi:hypothetical protein